MFFPHFSISYLFINSLYIPDVKTLSVVSATDLYLLLFYPLLMLFGCTKNHHCNSFWFISLFVMVESFLSVSCLRRISRSQIHWDIFLCCILDALLFYALYFSLQTIWELSIWEMIMQVSPIAFRNIHDKNYESDLALRNPPNVSK